MSYRDDSRVLFAAERTLRAAVALTQALRGMRSQ
jgi:hypothetical protein